MTEKHNFCWAMWIGGTILIVASWANVVTPAMGWVGFGVALAGTLLSSGAQQRPQQLPSKPREGRSEDQTPDPVSSGEPAPERPAWQGDPDGNRLRLIIIVIVFALIGTVVAILIATR